MKSGNIISYHDICEEEGVELQGRMIFGDGGNGSVLLLGLEGGETPGYRTENNGCTLICQGHDISTDPEGPYPKSVDQPMLNPNGGLSQNGLFFQAAKASLGGSSPPDVVRVYEEFTPDVWVCNGRWRLIDAWTESSTPFGGRRIFQFKLTFDPITETSHEESAEGSHPALMPFETKRAVWERNGGGCATCGATENLGFGPIDPYAKGDSLFRAENIQLTCSRHKP